MLLRVNDKKEECPLGLVKEALLVLVGAAALDR